MQKWSSNFGFFPISLATMNLSFMFANGTASRNLANSFLYCNLFLNLSPIEEKLFSIISDNLLIESLTIKSSFEELSAPILLFFLLLLLLELGIVSVDVASSLYSFRLLTSSSLGCCSWQLFKSWSISVGDWAYSPVTLSFPQIST